jgi:hypothetical protein
MIGGPRAGRGPPLHFLRGFVAMITSWFGLLFALALASGPLEDPADETLWPNRTSHANSDAWLAEHHDQIRQMRPRLLVLNFSNQLAPADVERQTQALIAALAESSRYHGYADPGAPVFLQYQVFKYVDLRDPGASQGNSALAPLKATEREGINMDYGALFRERFAERFGVADPDRAGSFLRLSELVDAGYVHEVWFFACVDGKLRALECVEEKPVYDESFRRVPGSWRQAGNGGDDDQPFTGRSVRINCINHERGTGCAMENLGHCLEGLSQSECIPYFTRYFREFAGFDLDRRYALPFDSFYPLWGTGKGIEYPAPDQIAIRDGDQRYWREAYVARGGNVHFPPNARHHYDMDNTEPVLSTIEDWRIGSGPGGHDQARPWTAAAVARYRDLAPDCMGAWMVYWRQNMPGLDNRQKDDDGRPMKNWWPFLFY